MRKLNQVVILTLVSALTLSACSVRRNGNTSTIRGLEKMGETSLGFASKSVGGIRGAAIRETALSVGAQSGLANRSSQINQILKQHESQLDRAFNFQALMLKDNVLPPVLVDGRNTLKQSSSVTLRISDRTYAIFRQARFATAPPNWREYLWMEYREPEFPHTSLLPKNKAERDIWNDEVKKGWHNGIKQANSIFAENLARVVQDFNGMILYRKLLAQGMVSPPYVAKTELGITGDANRIDINDKVLRIAALPALQPHGRWKPAVTKHDADRLSTESTDDGAGFGSDDGKAVHGKHASKDAFTIRQHY